MRRLVSIAIAAVAVPALAAPQSELASPYGAPQAAVEQAPKPAKEKKLCKKLGEEEIGSRFGSEMVCKTPTEWEKIEQRKRAR